jgi:hypothetical protein
MATVNLTGEQVTNFSAARLNDFGKTLYTDLIQLPYLNIALAELQEIYEANNVPVTDQTSAVIEVDAVLTPGIISVVFDDAILTPTVLPTDLIEIKVLWESPRDLNQWTMMTRVDYLSQSSINNQQISQFLKYQWATNALKLIAANADNDLKMDYIRSLFVPIEDVADDLLVQNSLTFLGNRTASLIAHDIEENDTRASALYNDAIAGLDRSLSITTKGRQRITVRRRPFRSSYKAGGIRT